MTTEYYPGVKIYHPHGLEPQETLELWMAVAGRQVKIQPIDYGRCNPDFLPTTASGKKLKPRNTYAVIVEGRYVAFI